jgi:hypothetical protein
LISPFPKALTSVFWIGCALSAEWLGSSVAIVSSRRWSSSTCFTRGPWIATASTNAFSWISPAFWRTWW